ncbi:MAG: hypothetical protein L6R37_006168 [Teloschistes peruensis]|nr:MAG: hypothetical protein L6R37_006168 [Teloschistes peruensis]
MDPATAAGIGMAVTSLAAQSLAGAMHAINLISSARNLEPDYQYLVVRLRLEQQRLCNWSMEVGLVGFLDGNDSAPRSHLLGLNRQIIVDTLYHIQNLAAGFIESNEKFGGLVPDVTNPSGGGAKMLDDDGWHGFSYNMNSWGKHQSSSPRIKSLPKRLKWATFYKGRYETLIVRLRDLNDVLIDLVDSEARVSIRQATRETDTTILHLHNRVDDLVQLFKALFADKSTGGTNGISSAWRDGIDIQQRQNLAKLAYFKAVNTSIEDNTFLASCGPLIGADRVPGQRLRRSDVHLSPDLGDPNVCRCEAELSQDSKTRERVWVEWRDYDPITQTQPALHTSRVGKLVSLLSDPYKPDLLRVPDCIGYFDDPRCKENNYRRGRLGFVFRWPSSTSTGPICLRTLITSQTKPMLTERIALAKAIGNCLMSLHSVNWLHKGIRSRNILFFPEEDGDFDYSRPYLSGFGYSRPSFREDMTEVPSQDPAADM